MQQAVKHNGAHMKWKLHRNCIPTLHFKIKIMNSKLPAIANNARQQGIQQQQNWQSHGTYNFNVHWQVHFKTLTAHWRNTLIKCQINIRGIIKKIFTIKKYSTDLTGYYEVRNRPCDYFNSFMIYTISLAFWYHSSALNTSYVTYISR